MNAGQRTEYGVNRFGHGGMRVYRDDDLGLGRQRGQRRQHLMQAMTVILAPVNGRNNHRAAEIDAGETPSQPHRHKRIPRQSRLDEPQGIDAGVAGYVDRRRSDALGKQRGTGSGRWREMDIGHLADCAAVHFLGERFVLARSQASLDVCQLPPGICGRLRARKGRGGITLDDHRGRPQCGG